MYVISKVVLEVIPPFSLLTMRLLLGLLGLGIFIGGWPGLKFNRSQGISVIIIGVIGYGFSLGFQFVGTKLSSAANGAVVTAATPAFIFLFANWILAESISRRRISALLLSTIGVIIVVDPRTVLLSPDQFWGSISLVAAALTWALYSVLIRKVTRDLNTLAVSFTAFLGGLLVAFPVGLWENSYQTWGNITLTVVAGVFYLGIISAALEAFLWNKAFELLDAGVASLTFFAQPVVGVILGVALLDENLPASLLIGSVLIGMGLWLAASEEISSQGE
ncbi:MAG: DMT family transporter [Chloroflexi bacterium]|nr:DMT family transporter [Chloroflexota bacterium]